MKLLSLLALVLVATTSWATQAPYHPKEQSRFRAAEAGTGLSTGAITSAKILDGTVLEADIGAQSAEGLHLKRIARVTYDVAVDGGTVAAHGLGVSLPANSIITRSWLYIVTQFSDSGSGTVAVSCEDANNIKTATDITGTAAGGFIEGQSTGAISAAVGGIAAACEVTATVATATQATGKALIFIEYVVGE